MVDQHIRRICVFCGSNLGRHDLYARAADELGRALAKREIELIYGGASVGLMRRVADAALSGGARVTGIMPRLLVDKGVSHDGLAELRVVESMGERKALMAEIADGFIALPGGIGTLEEVFEVLTMTQLGLHQKLCGLLDIGRYYDHLQRFVDHAVAEGFVKPEHRQALIIESSVEPLLDRLASTEVVKIDKWTDR